jgi:hypothetical protein
MIDHFVDDDEHLDPELKAAEDLSTSRGLSDNWPDPVELKSNLLPVPSFDREYLPEALQDWVYDIGDAMQCPMEFVAIPALIGLGAVLGRRIAIRPQKKTLWTEVPNLWGLVVGPPGSMKSPALAQVLKPLETIERNAEKIFKREMEKHELHKAVYEGLIDKQKADVRKAARDGKPVEGLITAKEPTPPTPDRIIVNNATYESLGALMLENENGLYSVRDELMALLRSLDREDNCEARGFYLQAWNGTGGYKFDRIIRGAVHIPAVCLSLYGTTQPSRIIDYIRGALNTNDGLIQRFGLMVWPDQKPDWEDRDVFFNRSARERAFDLYKRLHKLNPCDIGAEQGEWDDIAYLRFADDAREEFKRWRTRHELRLRADGDLPPVLVEHFSKYRSLVPSLALLNHLADGQAGPVSATAVMRALALTEYLEAHAKRIYAAGSGTATSTARSILMKIKRGELRNGFSLRDIMRPSWSGLTDREKVRAGLEVLQDYHYVREINIAGHDTGGRPKTYYDINPKLRVR